MGVYKIVRTHSAGVFAGLVVQRNGNEVDMVEARRLWYWSGAATLSELAIRGTCEPDKCKFPGPVSVTLLGAIEIIDVTADGERSIRAVPEWRADG